MSSLKVSRFSPVVERPVSAATRRAAAAALRSASAALARLARRVAVPAAPRPRADPQLEFYAEAGAPEGALYLDGQLVGWVEGVRRL
jgi:hypothetical protein